LKILYKKKSIPAMMEVQCMDSRGGLSFKGWVILVIIFVFSLFVVQNAMTVDIAFLVWRLTVSRVILLFGALGIGCFIGFLLGWEVFGRKKRKQAEPPSTPKPIVKSSTDSADEPPGSVQAPSGSLRPDG
jgi:uncharacterized integral membrane protein